MHCIGKLETLYHSWRNLQKNAGKKFNIVKEEAFVSDLHTLFDIAHVDVFDHVDDIRKEFLINQRKPERIGYIFNIEPLYDEEDRKRLERERLDLLRQEKLDEEKKLNEYCELASSIEDGTPSASQTSIGTYSNVSCEYESNQRVVEGSPQSGPSAAKKSRGTINIVNEKLVDVLDTCKITDRWAVHLIGTIAQRLHYDLSGLILNKTSIRRSRERLRQAQAENIKKIFQETELKAAVLHWDGKLFPHLVKREIHDRLPIIITNGETEQLLGISELENGTGAAQANAIQEVLQDWGLSDSIKALCCDTTASNLGPLKGAATLIEKSLERDLLFLPCRHHIFELVLKAAFEVKMLASSGPNVLIFKRFQERWMELDKSNYATGIEDGRVQNVLEDHVESIQHFVNGIQKVAQPRDDYKELLELTLIFLGILSESGVKFRPPGAIHHARWMAKAIYSLKIFLFRKSFKLTAKEEKGIRDTCIFVVSIYVQAWFTAPLATQAPNHDLEFMKKLNDYKSVDLQISQVTVKKFVNHLWYLSPEVIGLSFFDEKLPIELKRKMVMELNQEESLSNEAADDEFDEELRENCPKRLDVNPKNVDYLFDKGLDHFITPRCLKFFDRFGINVEFLKVDPSEWNNDENFQNGLKLVKSLKVVNDTAERGVRLIQNYNNILTNNEVQKQYIRQIVAEYHKKFPDAKKNTVAQEFK